MAHGKNAKLKADKRGDFPKTWNARSSRPGTDRYTKAIRSRRERHNEKINLTKQHL